MTTDSDEVIWTLFRQTRQHNTIQYRK